MEVYKRYFRVTGGDVIDAINECNAVNDRAHERYAEILSEIGAKPEYYQSGSRLVGIIFDGTPDRYVFKKVSHGWYPKKSCKEGRSLVARIEEIQTKNPQDVIEVVGLHSKPRIFSNGRCYYATLMVIPEDKPVAYIQVPWYDADPEEMDKYKRERENNVYFDSNKDAILWEPQQDMVEVKSWEVDKHISEWNESLKANTN